LRGRYSISGGTLTGGISVRQTGAFEITNPAAQISGGLTLNGTFSAVPGCAFRLTSSLSIITTSPAKVAGLGNLGVLVSSGTGIAFIEAAGRDLGTAAEGFNGNFELASLALGGANTGGLRLINNIVNNPSVVGTDALYVTELTVGPGATLDLSGLNLYFMRDGQRYQLLPGDSDANGTVDATDYSAWFNNYGQAGGWADGDFCGNGDGAVDASDYAAWFNNYGQSGGVFSVPEPVTSAWLILGGLAILRRKFAKPT
jgi:hypothetical protein